MSKVYFVENDGSIIKLSTAYIVKKTDTYFLFDAEVSGFFQLGIEQLNKMFYYTDIEALNSLIENEKVQVKSKEYLLVPFRFQLKSLTK